MRTLSKGLDNKKIWNDISLTFDSFLNFNDENNVLKKVTFFDSGQEDLLDQAKENLHAPCSLFKSNEFYKNNKITFSKKVKSVYFKSFFSTLFKFQSGHFTLLSFSKVKSYTFLLRSKLLREFSFLLLLLQC